MTAQRIDFKKVRESSDFLTVLSHYGIKAEKDGSRQGQHKALCPFHDDKTPSLKVNTDRNIFNCYPCDQGGNILDFVTRMEDLDPKNGAELRKGAIELARICGFDPSTGTVNGSGKGTKRSKSSDTKRKSNSNKKVSGLEKKAQEKRSKAKPKSAPIEELDGVPYNKPLSFSLKELVLDHPFFAERGITQEDQETFGLGIATRGMMADRMVIPIHNVKGELVAYCGRYPSSDIPKDEAKYKLPPGFLKDLELFNLHRIENPVELILVESYLSVIRLERFSFPVVSSMGRSISNDQIKLLKDAGTRYVTIMFDGDKPGRAGAKTVCKQLLKAGFFVRRIKVPDGFKPHSAEIEELTEMID